MENTLRYALVLLARTDPRLTRASLVSAGRLDAPPDLVLVVVPGGRGHLFAGLPGEAGSVAVETALTDAHDDSALAAGFAAVAPRCDVAVLMPEGVVLDPDYLTKLRDRVERWQDRVGGLGLVHRAVTLPADSAEVDITAAPAEPAWRTILRGLLRARSLLPSVLWLRTQACGNIRFPPLPDYCDVISAASFLDRLRPRGRTAMGFAENARHIRFGRERRSGFEVGHGIYERLGQLGVEAEGPLAVHHARHLEPRLEKARLLADQAMLLLSPQSRHYARTVLAGAMAARRERRAVQATVQRDLRELG
jgi:hypothetical protein